MPSQAEFTNNCASTVTVTWELAWENNGSSNGSLAGGAPAQPETFGNGPDNAGFVLTNFTGRVVVLLTNTGGFTPNMVASSDAPVTTSVQTAGAALKWTNYSEEQTVNWVTVGNSTNQGSMAPSGTPVTQGWLSGVTAVGFQLSNFTGSVLSVFGSTTLTAELQVTDDTDPEVVRAVSY